MIMDDPATASPAARYGNPIWLFIRDFGTLITMLPYAPNIILPARASDPNDEFSLTSDTLRDTIFQGSLLLLEIILLLASPLFVLVLPGAFSMVSALLVCRLIYLICRPTLGSRIVYSNVDARTKSMAAAHPGERWLFINGCAVNHNSLHRSIDMLAKTFGRPVVGIHNNSYGLIADLLECLLQRCFTYDTHGVRVAHAHISAMITDSTVSKVVLLCHSQGGIVASLAIDRLITTVALNDLAKLEVYTFGSAASHFSNPRVTTSFSASAASNSKLCADDQVRTRHAEYVIHHIEHYANEFDMVPRWGVLQCIHDIQTELYAGSVFVRMGASGHMFNQHYLRAMFNVRNESSRGMEQPPTHFLDQRACEEDTQFLNITGRTTAGIAKKRSIGGTLELGDGEQIVAEAPSDGSGKSQGAMTNTKGLAPVMIFSRKPSGIVAGVDVNPKSVRELTRLWRYLEGGSPD